MANARMTEARISSTNRLAVWTGFVEPVPTSANSAEAVALRRISLKLEPVKFAMASQPAHAGAAARADTYASAIAEARAPARVLPFTRNEAAPAAR